MTKTLIIGGGGFIGAHLAKKLAVADGSIDILDNFSRAVRDPFLEKIEGMNNVGLIDADMLDSTTLSVLDDDYTAIYQFAAIIGVRHVLDRPYEVLHKNVLIQAKSIELAKRQRKLNRFIFASTSEVYAGSLKHMTLEVPTPEDVPIALTSLEHPRTSYMLSKIYGEALTHFSELPYTILRPHNIFGPRMGMSHVIPEIIKKIFSKKKFIKVQNPKHTRAFCYIDDAVDMIVKIMNTKKTVNKTYNLGDPRKEIKVDTLVKKILKIIKSNKQLIFIRENLQKSPHRRVPSMHKLFSHINFKIKSSFDHSLSTTIQWYKNH